MQAMCVITRVDHPCWQSNVEVDTDCARAAWQWCFQMQWHCKGLGDGLFTLPVAAVQKQLVCTGPLL